ncbi:MAG: hypothetical protein GX095_06430 [Clostridiales bacterium]|jgi:hypothetical protein|nr:hypothetical protein [Clostridiales bacterium]HOK81322.1 hypothetical protein [Clostridia bacterium]HOL60441.1 hypothetical protein [Clostridia bacterium]HPO53198.1 hypothetical protein [Clostridia bacterium]
MSKKTSDYKLIVKNAKARMLKNDYEEAKKLYRLGLNNKSFVLNSHSLTKEELSGLCDKIREIESNNETAFAIGKLVDPELMATLSESEQERYVFEIARLYRTLREKLLTVPGVL